MCQKNSVPFYLKKSSLTTKTVPNSKIILRVPPLLSSCVVPPDVATQLLGSGGTAMRSNSYGTTAQVLRSRVHVTRLQHETL